MGDTCKCGHYKLFHIREYKSQGTSCFNLSDDQHYCECQRYEEQ